MAIEGLRQIPDTSLSKLEAEAFMEPPVIIPDVYDKNLTIIKANPTFTLDKGIPGQQCIIRFSTNLKARWEIVSDATIETGVGSFTGSNFAINSFNDLGTALGTSIAALRSTGIVSFPRGASFGSTAALATLKLPHGVAPTSPANGDMWTTTTGLFARINGVTEGPFLDAVAPSVTAPITLTSTDPGTLGPMIKTIHNTPSPLGAIGTANGGSGYAAGDQVFRQEFWGKNTAGTDILWGTLRGNIANATPGLEQIQWFFNTNYQGSIDDLRGRLTWDHRLFSHDLYEDSPAAGPIIYLTRNTTSPAPGDLIGMHGFVGMNDTAKQVAYGEFGMRILATTTLAEQGEFYWKSMGIAGVKTEILSLSKLTGAKFFTKVAIPPVTAAGANLNLGVGPMPTGTAIDGDIWVGNPAAGDSMFFRAGGISHTLVDQETNQFIGGLKSFTEQPYFSSVVNGRANIRLVPTTVIPPNNLGNGDVWMTATGMFARVNGVTVGPFIDGTSAVLKAGDTMTGALTLVNTNTNAFEGPLLTLDRNNNVPAIGNLLGSLVFKGRRTNLGVTNYGQITVRIDNPDTFTPSSTMIFSGMASSIVDVLTLSKLNGAIFSTKVFAPPSSAASAGLNLGNGGNPTTGIAGDVWTSLNSLFFWDGFNGFACRVLNAQQVQQVDGALWFSCTASRASLRFLPGVAPTTPADGDMWATSTGLFIRINGVTKTVTLT